MSKRCSSTKFAWTSWHQRQYNYILEFHRLHFYSYFHPSLFPPRPFSVVNWWSKWISRDRDQFSPPALRLIIVAVQWRQEGYWQERQHCVYNLIPNATSFALWNWQEILSLEDSAQCLLFEQRRYLCTDCLCNLSCLLLWLAELAHMSSSWPITGSRQLRSLTQYNSTYIAQTQYIVYDV